MAVNCCESPAATLAEDGATTICCSTGVEVAVGVGVFDGVNVTETLGEGVSVNVAVGVSVIEACVAGEPMFAEIEEGLIEKFGPGCTPNSKLCAMAP